MAVQNMYNNYLKRQKQNSTNQFRQKVANSLSGKQVGANTTQNKTASMMGNTGVNTLGSGVQSKPQQNISRTVMQPAVQSPTTPSNVNTTQTQPITPITQQNVLQSNVEPSTSISETQTTPQETLTPSITPNQETQATPGVGMMSLADINNAIKTDGEETGQTELNSNTLTQSDMEAVEQLAQNPSVIRMARASNKTPQQIALEAVNTQKEQFKKEWEQQKKELELQREQLQETYKTSVTDAENAYKESEKTLQENRYSQQEDLAVSGQRRGIQYSPQQLALENVANINLNKNLAEASTKRNELLNQLTIQLSQSLANVNMGLQNATVQYNKNVADLMAQYQDKLSDWAYNDDQTKKDQAFQKEMANLQNKWQAEQNALDRKTYGKSRSGGGYSYQSSYTPYSGSGSYSKSSARSYTPYSNDLDLSTDEGAEAYLGTAKQYSTDLYNALDVGGLGDINDKGKIYIEEMDKMIDYAKENGASQKYIDELEKTRQVAVKHLYNKSYARDTNTEYQIGDTKYKPTTPLSSDYINKVKSTKGLDKSKYDQITARTESDRKKARTNENFYTSIGQGRTLSDLESLAKKRAQSKKTSSSNNVKKSTQRTSHSDLNPLATSSSLFVKKLLNNKSTKKSTNNNSKTKTNKSTQSKIVKKVSTSSKNISTAKSKVQATTNKKAYQNNKAKTQSKFQKSLSNLKKNIANLFSKKKK